ncbi:hypothetical protein [Nostoc sp.]|uniref:hypothetical protein n=1 Tax=Nostoc sp. TaxID=1180 RepID=UPI002FF6C4B7
MSLSSFFPLRPWHASCFKSAQPPNALARPWRFVSLSTFFTTQIGLLYAIAALLQILK